MQILSVFYGMSILLAESAFLRIGFCEAVGFEAA
jgi:hypothetical protein